MIPRHDEIDNFREKLQQDGVEETKKKLRQKVYGAHDNWKCQEAEAFVQEQEEAVILKVQRDAIDQIKQGNVLRERANKIAWCAIGISAIALVISILVAIFK